MDLADTAIPEVQITVECSTCGASRATKPTKTGAPRIPTGWKRHDGSVTCGTCWTARRKLRAVTLPVASIIDGEWAEFRAAMREAWSATTQMSNWAMSTLRAADVTRTPDMEKLPPLKGPYLYPGARALWPSMPSQSVVAVTHAAEKKYQKARFDVVWTHNASLPTFRYPVPFPVHNQGWTASMRRFDGDASSSDCPVVQVRIGDRRWMLRLRSGHRYRRQLAAFRQIASGEAVQGELAIYRQTADSTHRNGGVETKAGGGKARRFDYMVKMVAWLPKAAPSGESGTLHIHTGEGMFCCAVMDDGEHPIWTIHGDLCARWIGEHRATLARLADDQKAEQRIPTKRRRRYQVERDKRVGRQHDRLSAFVHQTTAQIAGYAARRRVADVEVDDRVLCKRFEVFPWFVWRETLRTKLDERGISVRFRSADDSSGDVVSES